MMARSWYRLAWALWGLLFVVVSILVLRPGKGGKLYPTFATAGANFWHGEPLYGPIPDGHDQFRYSPLAALLLGPWHHLPDQLGGVLWRLTQAGFFLWALRGWATVSVPRVPWPVLALLALPLAGGSVFNAQVNLFVGACLLGATTSFIRGGYWWAACAIVLAAMFKVYPVALGLLLAVIEPKRFAWRLGIVLLAALAIPYIVQSPEYVQSQFQDWWARLQSDDRTAKPLHEGYHDFQKLLRRWGLPIALDAYRGLEVFAGVAIAGVVWRWPGDRVQRAQLAFIVGSVWCTLFGPATETATYALLAVPAAYLVATTDGARRWLMYLGYGLLVCGPVAMWFPAATREPLLSLIPQAHGALLLLGIAIVPRRETQPM